MTDEEREKLAQELSGKLMEGYLKQIRDNCLHVRSLFSHDLNFINQDGQPLHFMPRLELDPELLERPLYH